MSFFSKIGQLFSGATGNLVESIGSTVDRFVTTKGEREALKAEIEKAVRDHQVTMERLALEQFQAEVADRNSARNREAAIAATGKSDWLMYVTGCVALLTFLLMVLAVIFDKKIDLGLTENPIAHMMIGMIEGVTLTVFAYYFGTSKSSADKTILISKKGVYNEQ